MGFEKEGHKRKKHGAKSVDWKKVNLESLIPGVEFITFTKIYAGQRMQTNKNHFFELLKSNRFREAMEFKTSIIPNKLFRFQPPKLSRFTTLQNMELYLSPAKKYDDPFDTIGHCYDLELLVIEMGIPLKEVESRLLSLHNELQEGISVCFCENINNIPLWAWYAQNFQGFAIEYNFHDFIGEQMKLLYGLFPINYVSKKANITDLLIMLRDIYESRDEDFTKESYPLLGPILSKYDYWSFEGEWRLLDPRKLIPSVKPKAIYIGNKSTPYTQKRLQNISKKIGCHCYIIDGYKFNGDNFEFKFMEF